MESQPIVSIIIPVYNTELYLDECLTSLVNQTLTNIEIICINDASTDNSLAKLKEWATKDKRINVIDSKENLRQGGARNLGIRAAKGLYLGFVDSDDFVANNMFSLLIDGSNSLTADIVIGNKIHTYSNNSKQSQEIVNIHNKRNNTIELKRDIVKNGCFMVTCIFKKSLFFDKSLFYPEKTTYEDTAISVPLFLCANSISVLEVEKPIYYYRNNNTSTTKSTNPKGFFNRTTSALAAVNKSKELGVYEQFKEEIAVFFHRNFYRNTLKYAFLKFDRFPAKEIRAVIKDYKPYKKEYKHNKYYQKDGLFYTMVEMVAKYPWTFGIVKKIYRRIKKW